jgi:hypothetical protein
VQVQSRIFKLEALDSLLWTMLHAGKLLLKLFGSKYKEDGEDVAQRYPWLKEWDPGCPEQPERERAAGLGRWRDLVARRPRRAPG